MSNDSLEQPFDGEHVQSITTNTTAAPAATSDTPRTDDAAFDFIPNIGMDGLDLIDAAFARQLERELAAAQPSERAVAEKLREWADSMRVMIRRASPSANDPGFTALEMEIRAYAAALPQSSGKEMP